MHSRNMSSAGTVQFDEKLIFSLSPSPSSLDYSPTDIVFSTAHKSKGLEFDTVELTNDYNVFVDDDSHRSCIYM